MSDPAIRVNGLSKRYRLGPREAYVTLRDTVTRVVRTASRDALRLGAGNRRAAPAWIWALRDVSLDVPSGDIVGIIGPNGAGKSTFLKVLAGITDPTEGFADIRGRIGCLLEVGTGFHMELSGRENIFMSGALLGLSRREIRQRFDEIVAFAETGAFIDTAVKHYSSGMYMRLAFAVAAHLDPEILIVDEVLAVGDVEFQKKCIGKMHDVSRRDGRTVLFVSHNMTAIQRLCSRCVLFDGGRIVAAGTAPEVVAQYVSRGTRETEPLEWIDVSRAARSGSGEARFTGIWYSGVDERCGFKPYSEGPLELRLAIHSDAPRTIHSLAVIVHDLSGTRLVNADTLLNERIVELREGRTVVGLRIDALHLNPGSYRIALWLGNPRSASSARGVYDHVESALNLRIVSREDAPASRSANAAVTCRFEFFEVETRAPGPS